MNDLIEQLCRHGSLRNKWDVLLSQYPTDQSTDHIKRLISELEQQQEKIIRHKPVLGAEQWIVDEVIDLSNNHFAVMMDDGHIVLYLLVKMSSNGTEVLFESE